jgi:hypothetical protein
LVIGSGVANNNKAGLQEFLGVLIGEGTWGPLAAQVLGLGVGGELEDGSLSVLSVGDDLKAGKLRLEDQDSCGYLPYTSSSQG